MAIKIEKSKKNINPFGGINFVIDKLKSAGIPHIIDNLLGKRPPQSSYSYSDIILGNSYSNLCGGTCLNDIDVLNEAWGNIPELKIASSHNTSTVIRSLATQTETIISDTKVEHEFNINPLLNDLLLKVSLKTNMLKKESDNICDYDNVITPNENYDAKQTYKGYKGYQPGVAYINKLPIFVEGRNGNSNASFQITETLKRLFDGLSKNEIKISHFRSDGAAYQSEAIKTIMSYCDNFYVRMQSSAGVYDSIRAIEKWEDVEINYRNYEVASLPYNPLGLIDCNLRVVIYRWDDKKPKTKDMFTDDTKLYLFILTDNWLMTEKEVIEFYNARGGEEKNFDVLNNDFNWANMPFSFLNENTVFMQLTALTNIIYKYMANWLSSKVDWFKSNFRLKKFILRFITVASKWNYRGREWKLILFTDKNYELFDTS